MKCVADANRASVLRLFKEFDEYKASQVAEMTGLCTQTARNVLNQLADWGLLKQRKENCTIWFSVVNTP